MTVSSAWWRPHIHMDRRPFLLARSRAAAAIRTYFAAEGFIEVDTAALQVAPGADPHTAAFASTLLGPEAAAATRYLHTSPEFACKKLLAAGETKIFSFGHVFRNGERSPLHHPEFTLLEWYRVDAAPADLLADCGALLSATARAVGTGVLQFRDATADPHAPIATLSIVDAIRRMAGFDLTTTIRPNGGTDRDALAAATAATGLRVADDDTWSDLFSKVLSHFVEPTLGQGTVTALTHYPASEAALAALEPDPRFAQRFELFACGVELANAFGELTDAIEQRRRLIAENDLRRRVYGIEHPVDEDFLDALRTMPAASGIALGFDRLVMLLTGARHIEQVIWTPVAAGAS
jgi:lysyl-tRNA synthetase class 2